MRRFTVLTAFLFVPLGTGCAGNLSSLEREVRELRAKVDEVARTGTAARSRLDEVENRVLLLQDEIETQRIAGMRDGSRPVASTLPPSLPVVRVVPQAEPKARPVEDAEVGVPARPGKPEAPVALGDGYADIDEAGRVVPARGGRGHAAPPPPPKDPVAKPRPKARTGAADDPVPLAEYRTAYEAYEQGRTDEAIEAFRGFVARYPRHPYADNAQYWIGECLYDRKDFEGARREFLKVVSEHPDGNKVPDAMVKVGLCNQMLQQPAEARRMFDAVMLTYPDSPAAAVAMRLLGEMP